MAAGVTEAAGENKESQVKSGARPARKARQGQPDGAEGRRFFLAKLGGAGSVPELGRELPGEAEAMVESFKTGLSYFVVSEWRGVADLSDRKPQLAREAVRAAPRAG